MGLVAAVALASTGILTLLARLLLSVRLLLIQYLNILIIIIIIRLLPLRLEAAHCHSLQPATSVARALQLVAGAGDGARRAVDVVVGGGGLTGCEVTGGAQSRRLVVHESLLLGYVDRVHLHVGVRVHAQVLEVHVVGGPNEKLLLLLGAAHFRVGHPTVLLLLCLLLLLLLQLHVSVFIFTVRQCVI